MQLKNTQASLALDLLRALAAQAVCIGHTIGVFAVADWAQPPHVPYMQNVAVVVFFLLSGFLIAYTLDAHSANPQYGFGHYLVDRFARIYSALVPCLLAVAVIDLGAGQTGSTSSVRAFLASLLNLQYLPGPFAWLHGEAFGTAGQLWTLSIEWHLYLFMGALFFLRRSAWMLLLAGAFSIVPIAFAFWPPVWAAAQQGLTLLWFASFALYFLMPYSKGIATPVLAAVAVSAFALYAVFVNPRMEFSPAAYPLLALGFFAAIAAASRFSHATTRFAVVTRFVAGYSFTLYLMHYTVVSAIAKHWNWDPATGAVLAFVAANFLAAAMAIPTEMRHGELARFLKRRATVLALRRSES